MVLVVGNAESILDLRKGDGANSACGGRGGVESTLSSQDPKTTTVLLLIGRKLRNDDIDSQCNFPKSNEASADL